MKEVMDLIAKIANKKNQKMEATTVWAVISTLIITLGSTSVLNYLQTKRRDKCKEREREDREKLSYIDDYEARIKKLEDEIDEREKENRNLRDQVYELAKQVAILSTKLELIELAQKKERKIKK